MSASDVHRSVPIPQQAPVDRRRAKPTVDGTWPLGTQLAPGVLASSRTG